MMLRKFLAAALTFTAFSASAYATVMYDFTFDDVLNGGGTVDGTVTLPSSADGTYAASSVVVTSNTGGAFPGVGLGQYVGNPTKNSFVVSGGDITSATFFTDFGEHNLPPAVTCCSLTFQNSAVGFLGALSDDPGTATLTENGMADLVTFTLAPVAVPEPATLPLFATGLGALGLLGWRRKRKAQAVAWRNNASKNGRGGQRGRPFLLLMPLNPATWSHAATTI